MQSIETEFDIEAIVREVEEAREKMSLRTDCTKALDGVINLRFPKIEDRAKVREQVLTQLIQRVVKKIRPVTSSREIFAIGVSPARPSKMIVIARPFRTTIPHEASPYDRHELQITKGDRD